MKLTDIIPARTRARMFSAYNRTRRAWRVIRQAPDYRRLALHDGLNHAFRATEADSPAVTVLEAGAEWLLLQVGDCRLHWPAAYRYDDLPIVYREIFLPPHVNPHAYEANGVTIAPGDWVIDAGACEGFFTYHALRRGANVVMVEPLPPMAEALARTFATEIASGRVKLVQGALGAVPGQTTIQLPLDSVIGAYVDGAANMWSGDAPRFEVPVLTLDSLTERADIPRIDLLKMDVEGAEVDAIRGATHLLRTQRPKLSIAVYHAYDNAAQIRALIAGASAGYRVRYRGISMIREFGPPRPVMVHAQVPR